LRKLEGNRSYLLEDAERRKADALAELASENMSQHHSSSGKELHV
jgi:hypothetical protein